MIQNKEVFITGDGSFTFYIPELNEYYHSHHGAIQEAKHVFLDSGLSLFKHEKSISILEVGFGTGLNTLLTLVETEALGLNVSYTGLEAFPLSLEEAQTMNYTLESELIPYKSVFSKIHELDWNIFEKISSNFELKKVETQLQAINLPTEEFDLIYFDAFGPRVQPELWEKSIFEKLYNATKIEGVFVTYCAKGQVKRDLKSVGFEVETLPGPPGKREMIRARKILK